MRLKQKTITLSVFILALLTIYIVNLLPLVTGWGHGPNYENVSVRTQVNVTDAYPEILNITCNSGTAITLNAGTTKQVSCLIEIRDYNGGDTITSVNGTFYHYLNQTGDADDNNEHYTNSSCTIGTPNGFDVNATCNFSVYYYANNGTWNMTVFVWDDHFVDSVNDTSYATISPLYALNVTNVIDFGDMAVGDTSASSVEANVTNFGNMDINVSVYGFGGNDSVVGDGVAMLCDQRNISLTDERYSLSAVAAHAAMTSITGTPVLIPTLTVVQQEDDAQVVINSTYWSLYIDPLVNPFGVCNGTVVFAAEVP